MARPPLPADTVRATFSGPWWTGRTLVIVDLRLDGDIAVVRDAADLPVETGTVSVPSNLLVQV